MTDLTFAISVPVGSYHPFLPACLASLACQTPRVEIALLDASGDPRVVALGDQYADHFAYRRHGPDDGQSDAILEGWQNTRGEILGWLNADDILFPHALERARAALSAEPRADVVCGHSAILDLEGRMIGYHWSVEPPGPRLLEGGVVSQPSCFFRRAAYEAAGGLDASLHYAMDWDLWIRLYKSGARFRFVDAPLSMVLWGEDTKTASFNDQRRAELRAIIDTHAPEEKKKKIFRSFAIHHWLDRIRPIGARDFLFARLARERKTIFGVGADGRIENGAELWFAHYETAPRRGVVLTLDGAAGVCNVDAPGRAAQWRRQARNITVEFGAPVPAGETMRLEVSLRPGARPRLRSCAWIA